MLFWFFAEIFVTNSLMETFPSNIPFIDVLINMDFMLYLIFEIHFYFHTGRFSWVGSVQKQPFIRMQLLCISLVAMHLSNPAMARCHQLRSTPPTSRPLLHSDVLFRWGQPHHNVTCSWNMKTSKKYFMLNWKYLQSSPNGVQGSKYIYKSHAQIGNF